jgi:hypothetical protein
MEGIVYYFCYRRYRGARWRRRECARRAIAEAKQAKQRSVIRWVTKYFILLSRAPPCFGRHVKPLVPVAFAIVSTHSTLKEV